jgi:SPP1 gp7 family putative phage head morphogenesis protein
MATTDLGHQLTDKKLAALERRIAKLYRETGKELQVTINTYFEQFKQRDEEMQALIGTVQNGKEWTEQDYKQWRLNQIARGERYQALRDKVARRMTDANAVAVSYTNDATPGIYSLNRNYAAYTIEQVTGNIGFDLWDEQTVKRLMVEQPDLMPYYPPKRALKRGIDLAWGKKQITASVTSSILQGKSIKHMADDLQKRITTMNRDSAIRTARTAVTGAQNAGRMGSYAAAEKMGIKLKKEWLATLDSRTRHSHAMLDGEQVEQDDKFSNGCRFPGDPQGPPWEIYNCRCTMIAAVDVVDTSDAQRRARNADTGETEVISNMSYAEWAGWKTSAERQNANFAGTVGITASFRLGMSNVLKKSKNAEVKAVYAKYQNELKCIDSHYKKGAYFYSKDGGIHFDETSSAAGSRYQKPYQVAFHEFGHNIDWLIGGKNLFEYASNKVYNGNRLKDVIKSDYLAFKKASGQKKNDDLIAMLRAENMPLTECGNISDILEYCTNKSYPLGIGHGVKYHKNSGATEKEFFAEVLDSAAANEESFLQMQRIFPNAVKLVLDIVKGAI